MLRLIHIRTRPQLFAQVNFHEGVNIVMGEKWDESAAQGKKTNGVGKSLFVDFLHFALLRDYTKTRVSLIPDDEFPDDFEVELKLRIEDSEVIIARSRVGHENPTITVDGTPTIFGSLQEANNFLGDMLFAGHEHSGQVSFRSLMSLLMRDERSEFADVLRPHKSGQNIPPELLPHLHLMGIDVNLYRQLRDTIEKLADQQKALKLLRADLTDRGKKKLSDIPTELNEEQATVKKIDDALKTLEAEPAFAELETELVDIETTLERTRAERKAVAYQIQQIDSIPAPERIHADDIAIVYNRVKAGLGELVEKSLEQAIAFKQEIELFQTRLRQEEYERLRVEHTALSRQIRVLSQRHAEHLRTLDKKGVLQEIQTGIEEAARRTSDYYRRESLYSYYNEGVATKEQLTADRARLIVDLRKLLTHYDEIKKSLNITFLKIHQRVMESSGASLEFYINDSVRSKYPLGINAVIDDSGSHGIDHMAVFIYDCTLLFNEITEPNHPGFLLHDNIFAVDNDSLVQSLNFIHEQIENGFSFQYILTLNRDKIEADERKNAINLDIEDAKVLTLTKQNQLLGKRYKQKPKTN